MIQIFNWLLLALSTCACSEAIKDWVRDGSGDAPSVTIPSIESKLYTWDFSDPSQYSFDTNYLDVVNGKLVLKQVDQVHSGSDFNNGSHTGTYFDGSNLSMISAHKGIPHINTILPSQSSELLAYWKFSEIGSGTAPTGKDFLDSSGNNHDGIMDGTINSTNGIDGKALTYNGTSDRVAITGPIIATSTELTVSCWFYISDLETFDEAGFGTRNGCVADWNTWSPGNQKGFNLGVSAYASGFVRYEWNVADGVSYEDLIFQNISDANFIANYTNRWVHLVGTFSNAEYKLYVDGNLVSSIAGSSVTSYVAEDSTPIYIGYSGVNTGYINGKVDEVAIWKKALSEQEVADLYYYQSNSLTDLHSSWTSKWENIVGHWKMDGSWQDSSGNGNHGTAIGDATFSNNAKIGRNGGAFDGTGDYITISQTAALNPDYFSLQAWVYANPTAVHTNSNIIQMSTNPYNRLQMEGDGSYLLKFEADGVLLPTTSVTAGIVEFNRWYHIVGTYDGTLANMYLNGELVGSNPYAGGIAEYPIGDLYIGGQGIGEHNGLLDDIAIWNRGLTAAEVRVIFHRQKQKYASHYDSAVVDLGASGPWQYLAPKTTLPFYKEFLAASESSSDYSLLGGNIGNGLVGLWGFNEVSLGTVGVNDFEDLSSNDNHGNDGGSVSLDKVGVFSKSIKLDGISDFITLVSSADYDITNAITVSSWVNFTVQPHLISQVIGKYKNPGSGSNAYKLGIVNNQAAFNVLTSSELQAVGSSLINDGNWHFVAGVYDGTNITIYVDGIAEASQAQTGLINISGFNVGIGRDMATSGSCGGDYCYYDGKIDETAVWSRALTATEIEQLYRRGANRIKYQVKSCVDPACKCKSFDTLGNSNDCDGDGTQNDSDFSDLHSAQWLGKDGATGKTFSEQQNCSLIDMLTGDCDITAPSTVNTTAATFDFIQYSTAARPANNRYFQYRVIMEAEANLACSGGPCLPELTSGSVGPANRYFGGTYIITSTSTVAYSDLVNINFTSTGSCALTYQLSPDGTNYYYWNGSSWVVASGVLQSNPDSTISANISTFATQAGAGILYWKAFVNSTNFQPCELAEIAVTVVQ